MRLIVLGSSSRGNGYLLQSEETGEVLAIEAGVPFVRAKRALNGNIRNIVGCCISHEHGDHAKYVKGYLQAYIPVVMSDGTANDLNLVASNLHIIKEGGTITLGGFTLLSFRVKHDVPCFGYIIRHKECGFLFFATDCAYITKRFRGLNNIMIEANYDEGIIHDNYSKGIIQKKHYDHTILGHMSLGTCMETLMDTDLSEVNNIVLIHLSDANSNEQQFINAISSATMKTVVAAQPGMVIDMNKTPY